VRHRGHGTDQPEIGVSVRWFGEEDEKTKIEKKEMFQVKKCKRKKM
jgi:hypothetical protein